MITIGAGPAAFSAALYAVRYRLNVLVIGEMPGGTVMEAHKICNFPTETEISGPELVQKMQQSSEHHGAELKQDTVNSVEKKKDYFEITTQGGEVYRTLAVLMASGTRRRSLNVDGEAEFMGRGISYCATCDGMFYKDKTTAVVGGSDSAMTAALYLADVAEKVYLVYRGSELRGDKVWIDQVKESPNIEIFYDTEIISIEGENKVESIKLSTRGEERLFEVNGVFIEVGSDPSTELADSMGVEKDDKGFLKVYSNQATNIEGLWAAGDITNGSNGFRQIITAASEGAIAAESIARYIQKNS